MPRKIQVQEWIYFNLLKTRPFRLLIDIFTSYLVKLSGEPPKLGGYLQEVFPCACSGKQPQ